MGATTLEQVLADERGQAAVRIQEIGRAGEECEE